MLFIPITYTEKRVRIFALADSFGVTADELLGREDDFGNVNAMRDL